MTGPRCRGAVYRVPDHLSAQAGPAGNLRIAPIGLLAVLAFGLAACAGDEATAARVPDPAPASAAPGG